MIGKAILREAAIAILETADPSEKARLAGELAKDRAHGRLKREFGGPSQVPSRPARLARPELRPPREMPRRKIGGSPEKRAALLHALAHIELNAIDLALDLIARFDAPDLPDEFAEDWIDVAAEEALHFTLLSGRLTGLGFVYGDFPAHDGLWEAASDTAHDVLARLAVVPLVLEARGLDVTPAIVQAFLAKGDPESAAILSRILEDEVTHVAIGMRWFRHIAQARGLEPTIAWRDLVRRCFKGQLKPPFNTQARDQAGMPGEFYLDH